MPFISRLGGQPLRLRRPHEEGLYSGVDEETEEDILERVLRYGGSALAGTGNVLDYLGGGVRGGLADITDLLQGNSYENHLGSSLGGGLTTSENRVSGRDLAEQWGIATSDSQNWMPDGGDVTGFGIELLTDPLTYATFGASTALGRGAQMAGKGAGTFGAAVKAGERSLIGLGNPLARDASVNLLGKGTIGETVADGLSGAYRKARYGTIDELTGGIIPSGVSPGQKAASLFDPFGAQTGEVGKRLADYGLRDVLDEAGTVTREPITRMVKELADSGLPPEEIEAVSRFVRAGAERMPQWNAQSTTSGMDVWGHYDQLAQNLSPQARQIAERHIPEVRRILEESQSLRRGAGLDVLDDQTAGYYQYLPRQLIDAMGESHDIARQPHFENMPGGTGFAQGQIAAGGLSAKTSTGDLLERFPQVRPDENFDIVHRVMNDRDLTNPAQSLDDLLFGPQLPQSRMAVEHVMDNHGKVLQETYDAFDAARAAGQDMDQNFEAAGLMAEKILDVYSRPLSEGFEGADQLFKELEGRVQGAAIPTWDRSHIASKQLPPAIEARVHHFRNNVISKYTTDQRTAGAFGRNTLADLEQGTLATRMEVETVKFIQKTLGELAQTARGGRAVGDTESVSQALVRIGLADGAGPDGNVIINSRLLQGIEAFRGNVPKMGAGKAAKAEPMKNLYVPTAVVEDLRRMLGKNTPENTVGVLTEVADGALNMFKAYTLTWPGRWARDLVEGQTMNVVAGHSSIAAAKDTFNLILKGQPVSNWEAYAKNPAIEAMLKARGQTADATTVTGAIQELVRNTDLFSLRQGVYGSGNLTGPVSGVGAGRSMDLIGEIVGQKPVSLETFTKAGTTYDPRAVRGNVKKFRKDAPTELYPRTENKLLAAGEKAGSLVDESNRLVPFLDMLAEGYDPTQARKIVDALQVNYRPESFSKFERDYLKRLFPFYSFARKMTPQVLKMIAEKPGGMLGQMIRMGRLQEEGGYEDESRFVDPDYGMALPIPGTEMVAQGFGNPTDVINQYLPSRSEGLEGALLNLAAQTRPELKVPLELATDKHFYFNTDFDEGYRNTPTSSPELNAIAQSFLPRYSQLLKPRTLEQPGATAAKALLGIRVDDTTEGAGGERERSFQKLKKSMLKEYPELFREVDDVRPKAGLTKEMVPDDIEMIFRTGRTIEQRGAKERKRLKELQLP